MARLKDLKLERFCREYVSNGYNGAKAARSVGISKSWASVWASEQLAKPNVLARVLELHEGILEDIILSKEEVIAEMNKLATFDPRSAYDEEGRLIPIHEMDAATAASIKEIEDVGGVATKVKFLDNKRGALQDMMKYYNAFEDHQKSGAGVMNVYLDEKDEKA